MVPIHLPLEHRFIVQIKIASVHLSVAVRLAIVVNISGGVMGVPRLPQLWRRTFIVSVKPK
jgi:hypothetical protein